jgi:hypothetical protein
MIRRDQAIATTILWLRELTCHQDIVRMASELTTLALSTGCDPGTILTAWIDEEPSDV